MQRPDFASIITLLKDNRHLIQKIVHSLRHAILEHKQAAGQNLPQIKVHLLSVNLVQEIRLCEFSRQTKSVQGNY